MHRLTKHLLNLEVFLVGCIFDNPHLCHSEGLDLFHIGRFLDVLAGRKDPGGLSGEVLVNGSPQPPNFKCLSGYVVQVTRLT